MSNHRAGTSIPLPPQRSGSKISMLLWRRVVEPIMSSDTGRYRISTPQKRAFNTEEFVPTGAWTSECTEAYNRLKHTNLLLHPYDGWQFEGDFNFLRDLWRIESLRLFNTNETDLTPLYEKQELKKLEFLRVRITRKRPGFDLARFPNLMAFAGNWMPGIFNLEKASGLEFLQIWGLTGVKHWDLTAMKSLATLDVHGARTVESMSVNGLEKLRYIRLQAMPRLKSIQGFEDLKVTPETWLEIRGCKSLAPAFLRHFSNAGHVSFQGRGIILEGKRTGPWPDELI